MKTLIAVAALLLASAPAAAETKTWTNQKGGKLIVNLEKGGSATATSWDKAGKEHRDLKGTWELSGDLVKIKWTDGQTKCYPSKEGGGSTPCK
jgi:hypothetical protein